MREMEHACVGNGAVGILSTSAMQVPWECVIPTWQFMYRGSVLHHVAMHVPWEWVIPRGDAALAARIA